MVTSLILNFKDTLKTQDETFFFFQIKKLRECETSSTSKQNKKNQKKTKQNRYTNKRKRELVTGFVYNFCHSTKG